MRSRSARQTLLTYGQMLDLMADAFRDTTSPTDPGAAAHTVAFFALDRPDHTSRRGRRKTFDPSPFHRHDRHRSIRNGAVRLPAPIVRAGVARGYRRRRRIRSARPVVIRDNRYGGPDLARGCCNGSPPDTQATATVMAPEARASTNAGLGTGDNICLAPRPIFFATSARSPTRSSPLTNAECQSHRSVGTAFSYGAGRGPRSAS